MKNEKEAARRNVLVVEAVLIAILVMALTVLLVLYFEKDAPEQRGELSFEEMETAVSDGDESETAPQPEYVYERIHLEDSILGVTTRITSRFTMPLACLGSSICSATATLYPF